MSKNKNAVCCERCGHKIGTPIDSNQSLVDLRSARPRKKGGGRKPALDAAGVKRAEKMLLDGKEISDIARELICSERTIRRVLNREHKFSATATL